jgi:hypothetical protein
VTFLLAELLRLLDLFLPRIMLGKVTKPGHVSAQAADETGFPYLKRDLVRFLGIIVHGSRESQDRVRKCGGIPVVMNMCVIDDKNPCQYAPSCACGGLPTILYRPTRTCYIHASEHSIQKRGEPSDCQRHQALGKLGRGGYPARYARGSEKIASQGDSSSCTKNALLLFVILETNRPLPA